MQHYIYHWVPENMEGTILYPLNELKSIHPYLYEKYILKYKDREHQLEYKIPLMNCLWNDVVHTTAIDPHIICNKLREAGFEFSPRKFYKIPVESLDIKNLFVMHQTNNDPDTYIKGYEKFDNDKFETYTHFQPETFEYYKEMKAKGRNPLAHHLLTHVLYKGSVNTNGLEIIEA